MHDIFFLSATELARRIRQRELSPVEVIDAFLARIVQLDQHVRAYCTVAHESARAGARAAENAVLRGEALGPLHGVPVSVKDNIETAGIRTTYGSHAYEHFVPTEDAVAVERLKAAGAIVLGKTSLPEFGAKGVTDPPLFGHTRNPWALDRVSGGSSGGAAAAVAAGLGPIGLGNDAAGSVRIPASFCGVVGLKPSWGRIPHYPNAYPWEIANQVGVLTRTVGDQDLALRVLEGSDERDPLSLPRISEQWEVPLDDLARPWRIAWCLDFGSTRVDRDVREITAPAVQDLAKVGVMEQVTLDLSDAEEAYFVFSALRRAATTHELLAEWEKRMDPFYVEYVKTGLTLTPIDISRALRKRNHVHEVVEQLFRRHGLLVTPTVSVPAFVIGQMGPEMINGQPLKSWREWYPFTYPFNLTGHPAASIPVGWTQEGLPVGLQIVGRRFADRDVLAACRFLERVRPWVDHRPRIPEGVQPMAIDS